MSEWNKSRFNIKQSVASISFDTVRDAAHIKSGRERRRVRVWWSICLNGQFPPFLLNNCMFYHSRSHSHSNRKENCHTKSKFNTNKRSNEIPLLFWIVVNCWKWNKHIHIHIHSRATWLIAEKQIGAAFYDLISFCGGIPPKRYSANNE